MLMPEEFDRCVCGEGWFEKQEIVMIRKGSPSNGKPDIHKKKIQYVCMQANCRRIKCEYTEED